MTKIVSFFKDLFSYSIKEDFMDGVLVEKQGKKFVGELEVFDQQIQAAKDCFNVFFDKTPLHQSPILLGECQSGKTGVAVVVIRQFINWCKARGIDKKDRKIYFSINSANNDLLNQLKIRLLQSGLSDDVEDLHHAHYRKATRAIQEYKACLYIIDECHIALCSSNNSMPKPYQDFLETSGIDLTKHPNTWDKNNNFVLQISATPNTQVMYNEVFNEIYGETGPFKFIYLQNEESYLSVVDMMKKGRIQQSYKLFGSAKEKRNELSPWATERFNEFYELTKNEYGVLVLRMTGDDKVNRIKNYIKKHYPNFIIRDYNQKNKNIVDISEEISIPLPNPLVAIVRGALREGKTLKSTKYIKMVIDSPDTKSATVIQGLLGRCCGYPITEHNRHKDDFIIYCDAEEISDHVNMLEDLRQGKSPKSIASSRYNDNSKNSKKFNYKVNILPFDSADSQMLIQTRKNNLENFAKSNEYRQKLQFTWQREFLNGDTIDDLDTYIDKKIKHLCSITAQPSSNKSKLIDELVVKFEKSFFDESNNCFRVSSGAKVSHHLGYEILDGHWGATSETVYNKLFEILNNKIDINIDKKYAIFYTEEEFRDGPSIISSEKLKENSIFSDAFC